MVTFLKFLGVGVLNTAFDFAVLNVLVFFFGTGSHGELFLFFKSISFLAAVTNSYFMNKWWVFNHREKAGVKEPVIFFVVSSMGFLINVFISFAVFSVFVRHFSPFIAANAGALIGTFVVFAWNFIGYRFFVFKKSYKPYKTYA
ncbi:MAG: GtrA family protein [Minisyncoccota bacterium]